MPIKLPAEYSELSIEELLKSCAVLLDSVEPLGRSEIRGGSYLGGFRISGWRLEELADALRNVEESSKIR